MADGLACGHRRAHAGLYAAVAAQGILVSECPPGDAPGPLVAGGPENRLLAALGTGVVVVEAGQRSGALDTARHVACRAGR